MGKILNRILFLSNITEPFDSKGGWHIPCMVIYQLSIFCVNWKSQMAATAEQNFSRGPIGKANDLFSSEIRNFFESKLYMINHWMVPYNFFTFCIVKNPRRLPNITGFYGKNIKNYSYLKLLNHLTAKDTGMIRFCRLVTIWLFKLNSDMPDLLQNVFKWW